MSDKLDELGGLEAARNRFEWLSKEDKHDWPVGQAKIDDVEDFGFALIERVERLEQELAECHQHGSDVCLEWSAKCDKQQAELEKLRGAARADEERLGAAAEKAGILYLGCDTPDALADVIAEQKVELEKLREVMAHCWRYFTHEYVSDDEREQLAKLIVDEASECLKEQGEQP